MLRMRGQLRDWNEEFQTARELPNETIQERIVRDRALVKINCDFVEAATKGAIAIIEKTVQPINPLDPEKAHMYIYNNIFFSYAVDGRDFFKEYGGDKAAYVSVNNDLKGIRALNRVVSIYIHSFLLYITRM
jgi:protein TIF31